MNKKYELTGYTFAGYEKVILYSKKFNTKLGMYVNWFFLRILVYRSFEIIFTYTDLRTS